jgi:hypothetical protein
MEMVLRRHPQHCGKRDQCEPLAAEIPAGQHFASDTTRSCAAGTQLYALCETPRDRAVWVPTGAGPNPDGLRLRLLARPFPNARRPDCSTASVVSSLGPWRFEPLIREASSCYNAACERTRAIVRASASDTR